MAVLSKATEKEQPKRYQRASEFQAAIKEAMLPPKSIWDKVKDWVSNV
jgi:hypothetical protein